MSNLNIYIETYGCQMNEYDSELVKSILDKEGHSLTTSEKDAHVILLNTCAVRENAHTKIYHRLQQLKHVKAKSPNTVTIGILGCMAQNLRDELLDCHHEVDFIVGPDSYRELPRLIADNRLTGEKAQALQLSRTETYSGVDPIRSGGVNAWVAVMRGCDNMCTFCVVPYTRGRARSRAPKGGIAVADVPGVERVRFTSPHPKDFPEPLLRVISAHPNVCKHIHLPLQSANNRILDLMNRTYTIEQFTGLVEEMRSRIPGVALSTDIIVGFPTESDAEVEETVRAMETFRFDSAFIFKYSERQGTGAARKLKDDVPPDTKTERIVRLVELQKEITGETNKGLVEQTFEVLVEGPSSKNPGCLIGRTDTFKPVVFPAGKVKAGDLVEVRVERSRGATLYGGQADSSRNSATRSPFVTASIGCFGASDGIG